MRPSIDSWSAVAQNVDGHSMHRDEEDDIGDNLCLGLCMVYRG